MISSPLPPDDCTRRLVARIAGNGSVRGNVRSGRLVIRERVGGRSLYHSVLTATIEGNGRGTILKCRSGMTMGALTITVILLAIPLCYLFTVRAPILRWLLQGDSLPAYATTGFEALAVPIILLVLGRFLAREEDASLRAFVSSAIEGRQASDRT